MQEYVDRYMDVLKRFSEFEGRARREEYWMFALFNLMISFVIFLLAMASNSGFLIVLYGLFIIIPSLSLTVRRLHDIGKSGWMVLISLIPYIGSVILLVLTCIEGQQGNNEYGLDPKKRKRETEHINFTNETRVFCSNCGEGAINGSFCNKCGKELYV